MSETPDTPVPQSPAERVFPPWSIETLVAWAVFYVAIAYPVGYCYGWMIAHANSHFKMGMEALVVCLIRGNTAVALHSFAGLSFVYFFLKREGFSVSSIWGSFSVKPIYLGMALFVGAAVVVVSSSLFTSISKQITAPPVHPPLIDWRLLFATETASLAVGSITEELFFRGLLYQAIRHKTTPFSAIIYSALIFAGSHTYHLENTPQLASDLSIGILTASLFERTHSLTPCVALHFVANTTVLMLHYLHNY